MDKQTLYLKKVIDLAGGQSALARSCGITQQTVWVWLKKGRVPAERVLQLERISGGVVSRHDLRPDIYPREK
jgi:DNA-binding transcriptional regulator YdaS (Cro superfamily)